MARPMPRPPPVTTATRPGSCPTRRPYTPRMAWDFSTDPEFAAQLEWMRQFVDEEIEPLSLFYDDMTDESWKRAIAPLQQQVRDRGLWACHLDPELGGQGYGQVKLALMHEILGRCGPAPA